MHAMQPTITGSAPAPVARHRRPRRAATLAALLFAVVAILGLASTSCDADRSVAAPGRGGDKEGVPEIAVFTLDDLPATLNLSADQRTRLSAAISDLQRDRQAVRHHFGAGGRGRGRDGAGPRGEGWRGRGKRGSGARMHRGRTAGSGESPMAGVEPPMIGFLEKASSILDGNQFVILAKFLAGRRAEMRPGAGEAPPAFEGRFGRLAARRLGLTEAQQAQLKPLVATFAEGMRQVRDGIEAGTLTPEQARDRSKELRLALESGAQGILTPDQWKQVQAFREGHRERASERAEEAQPPRIDRITGMYVRILGLDEAQGSRVRQIMEATVPARRALAQRRAQGTIEPEDFVYEMMTIEKNAADQVRGVLTPDQAARFDALRDLLPRGLPRFGPMGGPMGGPMRGPGGPHRGHR
jgi:Spy/CpxP family protein refolding chaperone